MNWKTAKISSFFLNRNKEKKPNQQIQSINKPPFKEIKCNYKFCEFRLRKLG